jgi:hypothetical protein
MSDRIQKIDEDSSNTSKTTTGFTSAGLRPVPTTRVLAIGHLVSPLTPEQRKIMRPKEVPATLRIYLDGKIDQWWYRNDGKGGVVFVMNTTSVEDANQVLEGLPLHQAKLLTLGPLSPLQVFLDERSAEHA